MLAIFNRILFTLFVLVYANNLLAHHVLGRPSYSLGEDSTTPPSMQVETQIGKYFVTYMVFPAFPKAGQNGRVNLYATHMKTGKAFDGVVTFRVKDDKWFGDANKETLGKQKIDDGIYRQGFVFSHDGDYIISAFFIADGEPYNIDFPLRVGQSSSIGPVSLAVISILVLLVVVNIIQRKRLLRGKIQSAVREKS